MIATTESNRQRRLGLPWWAIVVLAALAAPRVVTHDLDLVGPFVNGLLVFVPLVCWVLVVLVMKVPHPVRTLLIVGVVYGLLLAIGHQVFWEHVYGDEPPRLGGNLQTLSLTAQLVITRVFAFLSSVVTGTVVGALTGAVAWGLSRVTWRRTGS